MKTLFLIRGLPGSGKTFTANLLSENGKHPVLSADMFFEDSEGNYNWDASKIKEAHTWCQTQCEMWLIRGHEADCLNVAISPSYKIFVANTFTQEWEMEPYFELAEKYGYKVVTLICENRHGSPNVHGVPDETLRKMEQRFDIKL
jgi:predicted kinase